MTLRPQVARRAFGLPRRLAEGVVALAVALAVVWALAAPAACVAEEAPAAPEAAISGSGLPLPRFVSLRADEVNVRTGPGVRYPVDWVYQKRNLPVEVIAEFEAWRKIRDWQGTEGWVHKSLLSGRRSLLVTGETQPILRRARPDAPVVALVEPGVVGMLRECSAEWCRVEIAGFRGWMRRNQFWGAFPRETFN